MIKLFRTLVLLLAGLLAISMLAGCGGDDDEEEKAVAAAFVSANPPAGSSIAPNASITLTFDNAPADFRVSPGTAVTSGKTVTLSGPFSPGPLSLTVTWADKSATLTYTVASLD